MVFIQRFLNNYDVMGELKRIKVSQEIEKMEFTAQELITIQI